MTTAANGVDALEQAAAHRPSLIVLDLMLPGADGLEVCRTVRATTNVPIIMLTARSTEEDKLRGLDSGADDYVTKPFSPRELVARVGAVLRRAEPPRGVINAGPEHEIEIDLGLRLVKRRGRVVSLTATEFRLLEALDSLPGRAFTRAELAQRAFGHGYEALERTIDVHVMNLRRKIEPERGQQSYIVTVFGVGYKFSGDDRDS